MICREDCDIICSYIEMLACSKHSKIVYYSVFTMTGNCIMNSFVDKLPQCFNESGIFLIVLNYDNGCVDSFKLVKEKESFYTQRIADVG